MLCLPGDRQACKFVLNLAGFSERATMSCFALGFDGPGAACALAEVFFDFGMNSHIIMYTLIVV